MVANVAYKIRVKFYSSTAYGETKLVIVPCKEKLNAGATAIAQYENIFTVNNQTGFSYSSYFVDKGYVFATIFKPTESGNYCFAIDSDEDTYIYVIDPRSNKMLTANVDYDDDSGEGYNPSLIKNLDKNVPYLIIYSMYYPNLINTRKDFVLSVYRTQ